MKKHKFLLLWVLSLIFILLICWGLANEYRSIFGTELSSDHSRWGDFGALLDGVLSPTVAFIALSWFVYSSGLQKKILEQTEAALKEARITNENQRSLLEDERKAFELSRAVSLYEVERNDLLIPIKELDKVLNDYQKAYGLVSALDSYPNLNEERDSEEAKAIYVAKNTLLDFGRNIEELGSILFELGNLSHPTTTDIPHNNLALTKYYRRKWKKWAEALSSKGYTQIGCSTYFNTDDIISGRVSKGLACDLVKAIESISSEHKTSIKKEVKEILSGNFREFLNE